MSDLFEYLEVQAQEENLPFKNAAAIAIDRSERRFGAFVGEAKGVKEFNARIALVEEEILKIAIDTCGEYGYDDFQHIARLVLGQLELFSVASPESEGKADETQKLKTQDPDGYYTDPSPKLNPGSSGDNTHNTNPAIPGLEPDESQDVTEKGWPHDSDLPDEGEGRKRVDVLKQKAEQVGPPTSTFPNKGQADPVTSNTAVEDEDTDEEDEGEYSDYPLVGFNSVEDSNEHSELDELPPAGGMGGGVYMRPAEEDKNHGKTRDELYASNWERGYNHPNWKNHRNEQHRPVNAALIKRAAEAMDFNTLSEMMKPSEAISYLHKEGMPKHEAEDSVWTYVNHHPEWAAKHWTSSWDPENPADIELSNEADAPSAEGVSSLYQALGNQFASAQDFADTLLAIWQDRYGEEKTAEYESMISEAMNISAVSGVKTSVDITELGLKRDMVSMLEGILENHPERSDDVAPLLENAKSDLMMADQDAEAEFVDDVPVSADVEPEEMEEQAPDGARSLQQIMNAPLQGDTMDQGDQTWIYDNGSWSPKTEEAEIPHDPAGLYPPGYKADPAADADADADYDAGVHKRRVQQAKRKGMRYDPATGITHVPAVGIMPKPQPMRNPQKVQIGDSVFPGTQKNLDQMMSSVAKHLEKKKK